MKRKINQSQYKPDLYCIINRRNNMDIGILLDSKYAELELSKSAHISVYERVLKELKEIENAISVLESHGVKFS